MILKCDISEIPIGTCHKIEHFVSLKTMFGYINAHCMNLRLQNHSFEI